MRQPAKMEADLYIGTLECQKESGGITAGKHSAYNMLKNIDISKSDTMQYASDNNYFCKLMDCCDA